MWNEELNSDQITSNDKNIKCVSKTIYFQIKPGENMLIKFIKIPKDTDYHFFTFKSSCDKVETEESKKINEIKGRVMK